MTKGRTEISADGHHTAGHIKPKQYNLHLPAGDKKEFSLQSL